MEGLGGILVLAIMWYILKPLVVGIWHGIVGLVTGKAVADDHAESEPSDKKQE